MAPRGGRRGWRAAAPPSPAARSRRSAPPPSRCSGPAGRGGGRARTPAQGAAAVIMCGSYNTNISHPAPLSLQASYSIAWPRRTAGGSRSSGGWRGGSWVGGGGKLTCRTRNSSTAAPPAQLQDSPGTTFLTHKYSSLINHSRKERYEQNKTSAGPYAAISGVASF